MNSDLSHVTTSWVQNILMRITQGVERVSEPFVHTVGLPRAIFAFVLGALSAAAYAPVYFLPAFIVSFTGLIWLCDGLAARRARLRQVFCVGWMFGFGQFLFGLYWIGRAFLVDADTFAWMLPFVAVAMPGGLALFSGAAVMLCVRFWTFGVHRIALFTFVWMGAEWLRGHILTGFPWNLPGYVWGDTLSVAQSTSVIGSYGLSLVTIFACSALAVLVSTRAGRPQWSPRAWIVPLLVWGGFAALAALGSMRVANTPYEAVEGIGLRIVQPSFDQDEKWKPENRFHILKTYLEMSALETTQADELNITHVIWPESATPFLLARDAGALAAVARTLKEGQLLLTGAPRAAFSETGDARYFNSFQVIDHTGSIIAVYDKHHLVPFGETLPFSDILNRLGVTKLVGGLGSFTRGPGPVTLSVPGTPAFLAPKALQGQAPAGNNQTHPPNYLTPAE